MVAQGLVAAPVAIDAEGILPEALEAAVQAAIQRTGRAPKVLYVVPHAHNPTGCNMTMARKRAVYAACCRHNILIVEDDPYIFLQFPETGDDMPGAHLPPDSPCTPPGPPSTSPDQGQWSRRPPPRWSWPVVSVHTLPGPPGLWVLSLETSLETPPRQVHLALDGAAPPDGPPGRILTLLRTCMP